MAHADEPLLAYFSDRFDRVFIALHPFVEIAGMSPLDCNYQTEVVSASELPEDETILVSVERAEQERRSFGKVSADEVDKLMRQKGVSYGWTELTEALAFRDYRVVSQALRTHIMGLRRELEDLEAADRVLAYTIRSNLFLPTEGRFQPIMCQGLAELFCHQGTTIVAFDEFDLEEQKLLSIKSLAHHDLPYDRGRLMSEDGCLRAETPWDDFFTVLAVRAGSEAERLAPKLFEGFWANEGTTIGGWFLDPLIELAT